MKIVLITFCLKKKKQQQNLRLSLSENIYEALVGHTNTL